MDGALSASQFIFGQLAFHYFMQQVFIGAGEFVSALFYAQLQIVAVGFQIWLWIEMITVC